MAERLTTPEEDEGPRNHLPTLMEVLSRRTMAPVDLFSFYIYMRDQQRSVDYLDFWLDVSQHLSLCRHYVRELHRSILVDTPDADKTLSSRHSSQLLDSFDLRDSSAPIASASAPAVATMGEKSPAAADQHLSQFLRTTDSRSHSSSSGDSAVDRLHSHKQSNGTRHSQHSRSSRPGSGSPSASASAGAQTSSADSSSPSPQHTVAREDIRASAEKILYTFLLSGSEREIVLPEGILSTITSAIEDEGRDDPEVFDAAKDYVFSAMNRDAFPGFLRARALGNLSLPHLMLRLVLGLLAMFGGLWAAFALVFLDKPRATRCWLILPFAVGVYCLASHQWKIEPLLALAGYSEYTLFDFTPVRETYVGKCLTKRATSATWWIVVITAALSCLFIFVPGKRL